MYLVFNQITLKASIYKTFIDESYINHITYNYTELILSNYCMLYGTLTGGAATCKALVLPI